MTILGVESIDYGVEDVSLGIQFFEDWGLTCVERSPTLGVLSLPSGQVIRIHSKADPSLPAAAESGSTVREVVWGVDSAQALDALEGELGRTQPVRRDAHGVVHGFDANGFGIGFCVSRQNPNVSSSPATTGPRLNNPLAPPERARPTRIGHVVFCVRKADSRRVLDFYEKTLQFRVTDNVLDLGAFLRCAGSSDHHNVFLVHVEDRVGFHHAAFEIGGLDEMIVGGKYMGARGWTPHKFKAGRFVIGSNLFYSYCNPSGGAVEYFCDMDLMDDNWVTRTWEKNPGGTFWQID